MTFSVVERLPRRPNLRRHSRSPRRTREPRATRMRSQVGSSSDLHLGNGPGHIRASRNRRTDYHPRLGHPTKIRMMQLLADIATGQPIALVKIGPFINCSDAATRTISGSHSRAGTRRNGLLFQCSSPRSLAFGGGEPNMPVPATRDLKERAPSGNNLMTVLSARRPA